MTDTKELIDKLNDYLREIVVNNEQYEMFVEIKSILEQQYQHEQNILNYGTDEPEEQQPQPDELVEKIVRELVGDPECHPGEMWRVHEILESKTSIGDESIEKIVDIVLVYFPKAFDNPKEYPEDINNMKAEIRKLLKGEK